jgi:hypothetical protein
MSGLRASLGLGRRPGKRSGALAVVGAVGAIAALGGPSAAQGVFVSALDSSPTLIGTVDAGKTYEITVTGVSDLATSNDLTFTANGLPTYTLTGVDSFFSPDGSDYVGLTNNSYGVGGPGNLYGALLGTYSSTSGPFFTIGERDVITPTQSETLYGIVNDCPGCYSDNAGGYTVSLTQGVPEPNTWAMMLVGLGALGAACRRRPRSAASSAFAAR